MSATKHLYRIVLTALSVFLCAYTASSAVHRTPKNNDCVVKAHSQGARSDLIANDHMSANEMLLADHPTLPSLHTFGKQQSSSGYDGPGYQYTSSLEQTTHVFTAACIKRWQLVRGKTVCALLQALYPKHAFW